MVQARPWQCFQFLHVVQVCIDSNQVAFAIIDNCPMNNIGLRPTFKEKKKKLSYIFHLIELSLSVYDWGRPCLLMILSPRLCLVCCFSVFVPIPNLWPKISCHHITRAGRGSSSLSALKLNQKLNSQWNDTLYRGLWRAAFLSLGQPPSHPLIFWKVCIRPWIFLVNMIKSIRVRSHCMRMSIKWTEMYPSKLLPVTSH